MTELIKTKNGNFVEKTKTRKVLAPGSYQHVQKLFEYVETNRTEFKKSISKAKAQIDPLKRSLVVLEKEFGDVVCIKKTYTAMHDIVHGEHDDAKKKLDEKLAPILSAMTEKCNEIEKIQREILTLEKKIAEFKEIDSCFLKQKNELREWSISKKLFIPNDSK